MSEPSTSTGHKSHHILLDGFILLVSSTLFVVVVDCIFSQFKDANNEGNPLTTAIIQASSGNDQDQAAPKLDEIEVALAGNLEKKDIHGDTPLMMACYVNFFDHNETDKKDKLRAPIVSYLIEKGATVNEKDKDGWTALFWASWSGMTETATVLVNNNSDISQTDRQGNTPLMIAAQRGNPEIVQLLLDKHAPVGQVNNDGKTALDLALSEQERFAATLSGSDREQALNGELRDKASVAAQRTVRLVQTVKILKASMAQ